MPESLLPKPRLQKEATSKDNTPAAPKKKKAGHKKKEVQLSDSGTEGQENDDDVGDDADNKVNVVPVGVRTNNSGYGVSILVPSGNTSEFDWSDLGLGLDTIDAISNSDGIDEGDGEGEGDNGDYGGNGLDDSGDSEIEDAAVERKILTMKLKTPTVRGHLISNPTTDS
ncbi:hypothetical protein BYT27DRAFT_7258948 [Phlegmacium glaucopus]|nr:hypothetical protein BYT27DRAFT_7258948 [Phlegmacium glaucopus]